MTPAKHKNAKIVISGPNILLNDAIADKIFEYLKEQKIKAICLDPYVPNPNDFIVDGADCVIVCIMRGKLI